VDKTTKTLLIAGIIGIPILLAVAFFAGRTTGGGMASKIRDLKTVLDGTVTKWDTVVSDLGSIRSDFDTMGTKLDGLETKLNEFDSNFSNGIQQLNGTIEGNQEIYNQYLGEMGRARSEVEQFKRIFDAGTKFIESVDDAIP
jgi:flagellar biosynthesis chaperone FliJ